MNAYMIKHHIRSLPYNIKYGFRNLLRWFPIIWQDRGWDFIYIYIMLRHKLYYTERSIRNGCLEGNKEEAKIIQSCVEILDRLIEDDYYKNLDSVEDEFTVSEYLKNQDKRILFDTLREKIEYWWD